MYIIRHKLAITRLIILSVLFSCGNNNDYEYSKFEIKLTLPDKWIVTNTDSTSDGVRTINCSAKGDDLTKVTIDIENRSLDTTSFGRKVRTYKENMAGFSPSFTGVQTSTFNGYPSLKFGYNASTQFISPVNAKGYVESFQVKGRTITVLVMQNTDETHTDTAALDKLLKSIQPDF
jgi:hypothetical protein